MGRSRGRKLSKPAIKNQKKPAKQPSTKGKSAIPKAKNVVQHQRPIIPFDPVHRILLIGEGDFSFSRALLEGHECQSLHATSYDSRAAVLSKYPQAATSIKLLEEAGCNVEYSVDATKLCLAGAHGSGSKSIRKGGWDRIVFNFPHTGGLTKDVNRQVRANQELIVGFLKSALTLLSPEGRIVVSTFEGEPYDLWNIRDLARHAGLTVEVSYKFQASVYPGYKHVRTLGNIEGGGGWKGEDRPARSYVFADKSSQDISALKKRKRDDSESDGD